MLQPIQKYVLPTHNISSVNYNRDASVMLTADRKGQVLEARINQHIAAKVRYGNVDNLQIRHIGKTGMGGG